MYSYLLKIFVFLIMFPSFSQAVVLEFVGPCESRPLVKTQISLSQKLSVGEVTLKYLKKNKIPFLGTEAGFNSIFNTPTGLEALEVLSDYEMLAYGWCFSVNGQIPESFADQVYISEEDHIQWWFGFARYLKGKWVSQCEFSYKRKSPLFCKEHK